MTDDPPGIALVSCRRAPDGRLMVALQVPALPVGPAAQPAAGAEALTMSASDPTDLPAGAAALPDAGADALTVSLFDLSGRAVDIGTPMPDADTGHHICHFETPPVPPLTDPPSYLLTVQGGGQGRVTIWVAPSGPPVAGPQVVEPGTPRAGQAGIDYTARDFASFCTMMRARMAQNLGTETAWALSHPADPLMTLVEALAARGDYLSYQQDAAGTEAYLSTARQRVSVRRHARLLDYAVSDGCNARTWLAFTVATDMMLPAGLQAVTPQPGRVGIVLPTGPLAPGTIPFETMAPLQALRSQNDLALGLRAQTYPKGTCSLELAVFSPGLAAGQVLIFEQLVSPDGSPPFGAHAVRLLQVSPSDGVMDITWHPEDALPQPLVVPTRGKPGYPKLYGNVVLADHGLTRPATLDVGTVPDQGDYRPRVLVADPVYAAPLPQGAAGWLESGNPTDSAGLMPSAAASLAPDPRTAVAQVVLTESGTRRWFPVRDLLRSPADARHVVVEPDDPASGADSQWLRLRFGDGTLGRRPLPRTVFTAQVRDSLGQAGQVKAGALVQVVSDTLRKSFFQGVVNPLPAVPAAGESTAAARLYAARAFRVQRRGVSVDDWQALARQHPLVTEATATPPTDAQSGCHIAIKTEPVAWTPPDGVQDIVTRYLMGFAVIGAEPVVGPISTVGLDIALTVYCRRHADIPSLRARLEQRLGDGHLPDGTPAFFHPQRLPPGRSVALADVVAAIHAEAEVGWVNTDPATDPRLRFARAGAGGDPPLPAFLAGHIPIARAEQARILAAGQAPGRGSIRLYLVAEP